MLKNAQKQRQVYQFFNYQVFYIFYFNLFSFFLSAEANAGLSSLVDDILKLL